MVLCLTWSVREVGKGALKEELGARRWMDR